MISFDCFTSKCDGIYGSFDLIGRESCWVLWFYKPTKAICERQRCALLWLNAYRSLTHTHTRQLIQTFFNMNTSKHMDTWWIHVHSMMLTLEAHVDHVYLIMTTSIEFGGNSYQIPNEKRHTFISTLHTQF